MLSLCSCLFCLRVKSFRRQNCVVLSKRADIVKKINSKMCLVTHLREIDQLMCKSQRVLAHSMMAQKLLKRCSETVRTLQQATLTIINNNSQLLIVKHLSKKLIVFEILKLKMQQELANNVNIVYVLIITHLKTLLTLAQLTVACKKILLQNRVSKQ